MSVLPPSDTLSSGYTEDLTDEMKETGLPFPENGFSDFTTVYTSKSGSACLVAATRYGRRFLLKCLKEDFRYNPLHRTALLKEFEIGIALDHPNIRRTIGFEDVEGFGPAIILEYVDGDTLENLLSRDEITPKRALSILRQIASALEYIHSKQVIHRDLKPANVMVAFSGNVVKLIDFNLSDAQAFTVVKMQAGTRNYMAPELLLHGAVANARTDIYSFGMIINEVGEATADRRLLRLAGECTDNDPDRRPASVAEIELPSEPLPPRDESRFSFSSPRMTHILLSLIALFSLWIAGALLLRS